MGQENLAVILHGGAGRFNPQVTPHKLPFLRQALDAAWTKLVEGAPGGVAVEAALRVMEACEYFNAGYGGYPNVHGVVLLDVGLMSGSREFVSLLNVRRVKYPSSVALDMMTRHKTLMTVWTHELMQSIDNASEEVKERYGWVPRHEDLLAPLVKEMLEDRTRSEVSGHGTVGCVVRDRDGRLFSGTSTGGVNLKYNGRIGDSPIIGSGVFADNEICGLSTTGHGESFMRSLLSGFIVSEIRQRLRENRECFVRDGKCLHTILAHEVDEMARKSDGRGGAIIVIPVQGEPSYAFNTEMVSLAMKFGTATDVRADRAFIQLSTGERIEEST
jgi:L-asparaginase / beta-aspartyl-peptidase